jgi:putative SOS response-associated peptidase YedK
VLIKYDFLCVSDESRSLRAEARFCLVPMEQYFEPCWETGKAVQWRIFRTDDEPFTVAAIWESCTDRETGEIVKSFSMLTFTVLPMRNAVL